MKSIIQLKIATPPLLITLVIACFALSPGAQAVGPEAPDAALPGGNTADGDGALSGLTGGFYNSAFGFLSLLSNADASFNTGVGAGALLVNTANENTATGAGALLSNTIGDQNTANGTFALFSNTTGGANTAMGASALLSNAQGDDNTAVGAAALLNDTATGNTAIGSRALLNNTTGGTLGNQGIDVGPNVAVGQQALESNTVASANTAVGYQALQSFTTGPVGSEALGLCTAVGFQALANATGIANSAFGYQALVADTVGAANTAVGGFALTRNSSGDSNTANGSGALFSNTTGSDNTATGADALDDNETGIANTAIGVRALEQNTTGNFNTALGENAGINVTTADNVICIGFNVFGANVGESCYIGNIFGKTSAGGSQVFINSDNKLGTITSSKRFKEDIKPMDKTSEALFSLKPVTFRYKNKIDPAGISQFGLVAEDVVQVNPDLVVRDKDGKPYSVRYDQVNAMLLNEFIKEHKAFLEERIKVQKLETALEAVNARLKEQEAKIEKVSAQIEISKQAPKVVLSNE
jgi:trimeric autotransporter adhesin